MNLADLCEVAPDAGDAVALRGRDRTEYVITGEVAGGALEDTPEDGDRVLEFAVDEFLAVDDDGGVTPRREYLVDLPPIQHNLRDTPRPAPLPALVFSEEEPLAVALPVPTYRGSRVSWYDTRPEGALVELTAGAMVDPQTVLPDSVMNEVRL